MSPIEAAKYYASIGIVTQPLKGSRKKCKSPGKQPFLDDWQKIEKPFTDSKIDRLFKKDNNIGYICGARSNLTVIDVDWYVKGIWDEVLQGVSTAEWVMQSHTTVKWHYLFRYFPDIKAKTYQELGFDILSDTKKKDETGIPYVAGNNCVATPSIHPDGNKYQITGNIEDRPAIPEIVIKRLKYVVQKHEEIKDKILPRCRSPFQKLWSALFIDKTHQLYHQTSIFFGDKAARDRFLHLCAELKANGANNVHLDLVCKLVFGDRYNSSQTAKELQYINALSTATAASLLADPVFKQFHTYDDGKKGMRRKLPVKQNLKMAKMQRRSRRQN